MTRTSAIIKGLAPFCAPALAGYTSAPLWKLDRKMLSIAALTYPFYFMIFREVAKEMTEKWIPIPPTPNDLPLREACEKYPKSCLFRHVYFLVGTLGASKVIQLTLQRWKDPWSFIESVGRGQPFVYVAVLTACIGNFLTERNPMSHHQGKVPTQVRSAAPLRGIVTERGIETLVGGTLAYATAPFFRLDRKAAVIAVVVYYVGFLLTDFAASKIIPDMTRDDLDKDGKKTFILFSIGFLAELTCAKMTQLFVNKMGQPWSLGQASGIGLMYSRTSTIAYWTYKSLQSKK